MQDRRVKRTLIVLLLSVSIIFILPANSNTLVLEKTVKLSTKGATKISAVGQESIAVQKKTTDVTVLQGKSYESQVSSLNAPSSSEVKVKHGGIFVKDGSSLSKRKATARNRTTTTVKAQSNLLVYSDYLIAGIAVKDSPAIFRLNFSDLKTDTFKYSNQGKSAVQSLKDAGNGEIIAGAGKYLLIIDNRTLALRQSIQRQSKEIDDDKRSTGYIKAYYDVSANESTILIKEQNLCSIWKRPSGSKNYEIAGQFVCYNPAGATQISIINSHSGSLFAFPQIIHFSNFNSIVSRSYEPSQAVWGTSLVSVSDDESMFVVKRTSNQIYLYKLDSNNSMTTSNYILPITGSTDLSSGSFSSDGKYLFTSLSFPSTGVIRVNLNANSSSLITDSDGTTNNQLDHILLKGTSSALITICSRSSQYYLLLRDIESLKIVQQYPLNYNFTVLGVKLVGVWGSSFAVIAKKKSDNSSNDSQVHMFDLQDNTIIDLTVSVDVNFYSASACSNYLISYVTKDTLRIFNYLDLSVAKELSLSGSYFYVQKNILLLANDNTNRRQVYDLSKSLNRLGMIDIGDYDNKFGEYNRLNVVLAKKGLLLVGQRDSDPSHPHSVVFYNISSPSISDIATIPDQPDSVESQVYANFHKDDNTLCNQAIYIRIQNKSRKLASYSQCDGSVSSINLAQTQPISKSKLFLSGDGRYVITSNQIGKKTNWSIQVRPVGRLDTLVAHQSFAFNHDVGDDDAALSVDVVDNSTIVFKVEGEDNCQIMLSSLQQQQDTSQYQMTSISLFDVSANDISVFVGPSQTNPNATILIVKSYSSESILFQTEIQQLIDVAISPRGDLIAAYSKTEILRVWNVTSGVKLLEKSISGIVDMKFTKNKKLILRYISSYEVLQISTNSTLSLAIQPQVKRSQLKAAAYDVQVSNSQSLIAQIIDNNIKIYTTDGQLVGSYTLPINGEIVVSVSFTPSDKLVVLTNQNNLYVLSFSDCPQGRFLDSSSVCYDCSFICSTCEGSAGGCKQYSAAFFVLIIGSILLLVGGIVFVVIRKRRAQKWNSEDTSEARKILTHDGSANNNIKSQNQ